MLQWDSNPDAVEYHVYYRLQNTEAWLDFPGGVTKETSIDLPPGVFEPLHVYEFTVKAFNECGNSSDYSDSVTFSACEALNIIENLRITVELQLAP